MTIGEWLQETSSKFKESGIDSARLDTLILLEHFLNTTRATLLAHPETTLPATTIVKLNAARALRLDGVPVAYILHRKEFYGREYVVDEHVLIPRPETESMIDIVKTLNYEAPRILDIGTGSGCIAISIELEIPRSKVTATDISAEAIKIAKLNAKSLGARITFMQTDLLEGLENKRFDIVCANLPYVPDGLVTSTEITKEPELALFSGADGLDHYRRLFDTIHMLNATHILTESLETQHAELTALAQTAGFKLVNTNGLVQLFTNN